MEPRQLLKLQASMWDFHKFQDFHYFHKFLNIYVFTTPELWGETKKKLVKFSSNCDTNFLHMTN